MTCLQSRTAITYIILAMITIGLGIVVSAFLQIGNTSEYSGKIDEYKSLTFSDQSLIVSLHQESDSTDQIDITLFPEQITSKTSDIIVSIQNNDEAQAWGARNKDLTLEKEENGEWYFSEENVPPSRVTEEELLFSKGERITYQYQLTAPLSPGKYRFSALFLDGLISQEFVVTS